MFLQPKKKKFKKEQKGRLKFLAYKANKIVFGNFGLQAKESGTISARQLEAARQAINRKIKRKGKVWIRVFPDKPVTKKPTEVRMGKGKGSVAYWVTKVRAGTIIFELCGTTLQKSVLAFKTGGAKLPVKTQIIKH
jgi:large subunit ribosomal protein L16